MNSQGFEFVPAAIWSECNFFMAERYALKVLIDIPFAGKGIDEGLLVKLKWLLMCINAANWAADVACDMLTVSVSFVVAQNVIK